VSVVACSFQTLITVIGVINKRKSIARGKGYVWKEQGNFFFLHILIMIEREKERTNMKKCFYNQIKMMRCYHFNFFISLRKT